ncbi:MAG: cytochrome c [Alphaproteobacteria bacterium]|nr:cytochrome c [Alphaproteobacteria bacterium]
MPLKRGALLLALAAAVGVAGYFYFGEGGNGRNGAPIVAVDVPATLSARAQTGRETYEANCASCHGRNAAGQEGLAPPLVHVIYEPGHHGDESFQRAVARGVRAHHWRFGNMPPVDGLTRREVAGIVAYVRELQRANGIR